MNKRIGANIGPFIRGRNRSILFGGPALELRLVVDYLRTASNRAAPPRPRMVQIEPTRECNLSCSMCIREGPPGGATMSLELFRTIVSRDFAYPHALLLYGQGEPFLSGDLFEMIRLERDAGNFVTTVTNGTLIDRSMCSELARSGLNVLRISLDGATAATYCGVRRGGDFDRVMGNLELISQHAREWRAGPKLALTFMALKENCRDLPEMVELASRLGIRYLEIKDLPPYADSPLKPLSMEMASDNGFRDDLQGIIGETKKRARRRNVTLIMAKFHCVFGSGTCLNPWFKTFITWEGNVTVCSKLFDPAAAGMGDLSNSTFEEIWYGDPYRSVRAKVRNGAIPFEGCRMLSI